MSGSGSTLVEQILASHSMIEGAGELFELPELVAPRLGVGPASLAEAAARLDADDLRARREEYLRAT